MKRASAGVERGVWIAPWLGANGETILVAVRRDGRELAQRPLNPDDDHLRASDELWERLDADDPQPTLTLVSS